MAKAKGGERVLYDHIDAARCPSRRRSKNGRSHSLMRDVLVNVFDLLLEELIHLRLANVAVWRIVR